MVGLIYIINFFLWVLAALVIGGGSGSEALGWIYFILGYPLSLILLRYSDNYTVSYLDRLKHPPFTLWYRKLIWSNGVATGIIWGALLLFLLSYKIYTS
jgi:hypothetical protein